MSSVPRTGGKYPPMTEVAWRFFNLTLYMQRYACDSTFHERFADFYQRHQAFVRMTLEDKYGDYLGDDPTSAERAFYNDREKFMDITGLVMLPGDYGIQQLDHWLNIRYKKGSLDWSEPLLGTEISPPSTLGLRDLAVERDDRNVPVICVSYKGTWEPGESSVQAVERITKELRLHAQQEVERILTAYEKVGYIERDSRPAQESHLNWLYRRVAYRETCQEIKARYSENVKPETIDRIIRATATKIGIMLTK